MPLGLWGGDKNFGIVFLCYHRELWICSSNIPFPILLGLVHLVGLVVCEHGLAYDMTVSKQRTGFCAISDANRIIQYFVPFHR